MENLIAAFSGTDLQLLDRVKSCKVLIEFMADIGEKIYLALLFLLRPTRRALKRHSV